METRKRSWRQIVRIAYGRPLAMRWRKDDVSAYPGRLFDSLVVVSCVTLALHYFFGVVGMVGALSISLPFFLVMENKKRSAKKAVDVPATKPVESAATEAAPVLKRAPIKTFRVDDCSASVWVREATVRGEQVKFYSVTFERSYKALDGWKFTKSFDMASLGKVVTLCQQVSEWHQSLQA